MKVNDIEQLVTIGRKEKACPYYGTRFAIPAAQVINSESLIKCYFIFKSAEVS